ncbi:MAG: hypothetical protein J6K76_08455 [Spirochaetaceae bacterium]|nr:hypothetical protein [Spirochaetaceae bacterium]
MKRRNLWFKNPVPGYIGGGYKELLTFLCILSLSLGQVMGASPTNKASAGMYGTSQDTVSSKTGMSSLEFKNVFVYGDYATESINIGVATRFSDVWLGIEYSGNFWNSSSNDVDDPLNTLGTATTHGFTGKSEPFNSLKTTIHLADMPFPMGFHVGFTLGGEYETGEYSFANNSFTQRTDYDNDYERGFKNNLTYTPSLGYKISVPVGNFVISPTVQADLGIAQNNAYAKYTTPDGISNSLEQKQLTYLPLASLQIDTDLPPLESISHTVGVQYDYAGSFAQNTTFTQEDTAGITITEVKAEQSQTHLALLRYTQKVSITDQVRLGWQFRVTTEFSNRVIPSTVTYNTNSRDYDASPSDVETITTVNDETPLKTGASDGRVYETSISKIILTPLFRFGLQWDVIPARLVFNAGVEFEPFAFFKTDTETVVKEQLQSATGQAKTVKMSDLLFDTPLGKFATGLTFHIAPTVVLDTALALDISRNSVNNLSVSNIFDNSLVMLALNVSL